MTDRAKPCYMIGVVAEMLGVHPQTLRFYEKKGLLRPSRTEGRTRMYSPEDVEELARLLAGQQLARTVRFVAFVNEEAPLFQTDAMGSWLYVRRSRARGEQVVAMLSIETIGFYSDIVGSQHYPFPFGLLYPRTGNFIGFVGNIASRALVRRSIAAFRQHTPFPSECVAAPGWMTGIGWSDHWAFWREGYPGVMVTDTALFRYAPYHTRGDTPDQINYERMARVVAGLARVVTTLADAPTL